LTLNWPIWPGGQEGEVVETDSPKPRVHRVVNDHIYNATWAIQANEGAFMCECGNSLCPEIVAMTPSKYVRLRDRGELVYAQGHGGAIQ
jgi:hypothetical protein